MKREEFIVGYMERSNLSLDYRTEDGFHIPNCSPVHALECFCDEEGCEGWAMVPDDLVVWHKFQNGLIGKEEYNRSMALEYSKA